MSRFELERIPRESQVASSSLALGSRTSKFYSFMYKQLQFQYAHPGIGVPDLTVV